MLVDAPSGPSSRGTDLAGPSYRSDVDTDLQRFGHTTIDREVVIDICLVSLLCHIYSEFCLK